MIVNKMNDIKKIFLDRLNILVVDKYNELWILGDNKNRKTGFGTKNETIYIPIRTGMKLDDNEEIKKFYAYKSLVIIHTTTGNVFISRFLYKDEANKIQPLRNNNDTDTDNENTNTNSDGEHSGPENQHNHEHIDDSDDDHGHFNYRMQEQIDPLNNNEYSSSLESIIFHKNYNVGGFELFETGIENITLINGAIFFMKDGHLCFYSHKFSTSQFKELNCFYQIAKNDRFNYLKLILPFDYESIRFFNNFVYVYAHGYHHMFSFKKTITWIFFKTDIKFLPESVYFNSWEEIYIRDGKIVYKYSHSLRNIVELANEDDGRIIMAPSTSGSFNILVCVKKDGIYNDDHYFSKLNIPNDSVANYMVDFLEILDTYLVLVNINEPWKYKVNGHTLFWNINQFKYYKLNNDGLVYYDNNNTLYYVTIDCLSSNKYGTMEVEKIILNDECEFYVYMFNNVPSPITNMMFTNNIIVIQSDQKFYYHMLDNDDEYNFQVDKFTEITFPNVQEQKSLVNKNYVNWAEKIFNDETMTLSINNKPSNKFRKFLLIMEMLRENNNFDIQIVEQDKTISFGDGPKREFMEEAMMEFSDKYLIKYNTCTEFNIKKLKKFSDDELFCLGMMLHAVICYSNNNLPIRLPLSLLACILNKDITLEELEYFANLEDPELFKNISKYGNNPELFREMDSNFDSYFEYLKYICKFNYKNEKNNIQTKLVGYHIALGFLKYYPIKNLHFMNYPTLDFYLSGDYFINRKRLINNLVVISDDHKTDYHKIIIPIIQNLSEEKLSVLLKNWSGTSLVKKSTDYRIHIINTTTNRDINYFTCNVSMELSKRLFEHGNTELIVDIITTPMTSMVDNVD